MLKTQDLKKNVKIELDGKPYVVVEFQHVNPGKGSAFVKTKLKNLETGLILERTFKSGVETFNKPDLDNREMEYLYNDQEGYHFMDQKSYETVTLLEENVGDARYYLQEGIKLDILYYNERPISLELPNFVSLRVKETDPGLKGDTAAGGTKKAIMETDLQINVPLFIETDELLKVDTRTGEYVERVKG